MPPGLIPRRPFIRTWGHKLIRNLLLPEVIRDLTANGRPTSILFDRAQSAATIDRSKPGGLGAVLPHPDSLTNFRYDQLLRPPDETHADFGVIPDVA
jgi:hypothetical protein